MKTKSNQQYIDLTSATGFTKQYVNLEKHLIAVKIPILCRWLQLKNAL